ncbi:MAG: adenylosuccinate synthetase [Deltaproteobacteria bacterium]|nr:adenylosuccinate synthetase [Deltaproteobacteria bacterium]
MTLFLSGNPQLPNPPTVLTQNQPGTDASARDRAQLLSHPVISRFHSPSICVVGASFGDEGKGRIVDDLLEMLRFHAGSENAVAVVLKANGGANSGHTANGHKLNLLPSGVVDEHVPHIALGRGVVADPLKLTWETKTLEAAGLDVMGRLAIDPKTMLSTIIHRVLDKANEIYRTRQTGQSRGSTGRGITPAFADETTQQQIFFGDLAGSYNDFYAKLSEKAQLAASICREVYGISNDEWFQIFEELTTAEQRANRQQIEEGTITAEELDFRSFCGDEPFSFNLEPLARTYWKQGQKFLSNITDVSELILAAHSRGQFVISEHGQGYFLDRRHGFTPNVTASSTWVAGFFDSANIPCDSVYVVAVAKAYVTKVGTHLRLTQIPENHPLIAGLDERGTTTGRDRQIDWFDAVEMGHVIRHGGVDEIAINKLDLLGCGASLQVCRAYRKPDGSIIQTVPPFDAERSQLEPIYVSCDGWEEDISSCRTFAELPAAAQRYIGTLYRYSIEAAYPEGGSILPWRLPTIGAIGVGPNRGELVSEVPSPDMLLELGGMERTRIDRLLQGRAAALSS